MIFMEGKMKPKFITFTGADDFTNIDEMQALSDQYPIEWGILFSMKRQGSPRYPSLEWVEQLSAYPNLRKSAHLCGAYSDDVVNGVSAIHTFLDGFKRIQVNTQTPNLRIDQILKWVKQTIDGDLILQCRGDFPDNQKVNWLFDVSGGNGQSPTYWPAPPRKDSFVGYAGGLGPNNVKQVVKEVGFNFDIYQYRQAEYWIDMETHIRTDGKFDIDKCAEVCRIVYEE